MRHLSPFYRLCRKLLPQDCHNDSRSHLCRKAALLLNNEEDHPQAGWDARVKRLLFMERGLRLTHDADRKGRGLEPASYLPECVKGFFLFDR